MKAPLRDRLLRVTERTPWYALHLAAVVVWADAMAQGCFDWVCR